MYPSVADLIWVFSFLRADSRACNLRTSWKAQRSSFSRHSLNFMASCSWPSRDERMSFSSLSSGSLASRLLAAAPLDPPLILCVGTSFPSLKLMEEKVEVLFLMPVGEDRLRLRSRLRATSRARQRASLPCSADRRSSTSSLRAAASSGRQSTG